MTDNVARNYTLHQRRMREALYDCRDLDAIKAWLDENVVGAPVTTSDFRQRTLDQRKDDLHAQAMAQYHETLASGFDDGTGTMWAATGDARDRVLDLTQRIQEYRAGKAASPLPNGKSTVRLRDANNQPHEKGPDEIVMLAEQGSDF